MKGGIRRDLEGRTMKVRRENEKNGTTEFHLLNRRNEIAKGCDNKYWPERDKKAETHAFISQPRQRANQPCSKSPWKQLLGVPRLTKNPDDISKAHLRSNGSGRDPLCRRMICCNSLRLEAGSNQNRCIIKTQT